MNKICELESQTFLEQFKKREKGTLIKCNRIFQKKRLHLKWNKEEKLKRMAALPCPKQISSDPWSNTELEAKLPIQVAKATLTGPIPKRSFQLAQPKQINNKKDDLSKTLDNESELPSKKTPSFRRMLELSRPKPLNKCIHPQCFDYEQGNDIKYFTPRRHHKIMSAKDWMDHKEWLKERAKPKRMFNAPIEKKFISFESIEKMEESINRLSTLPKNRVFVPKKIVRPWEKRLPGKLEPLDLPFVNRLSKPKKISSETQMNMNYDPYTIKKSALTAVASKRTLELAQPRFVKAVELDKENKEHAVSKKALKYKATNRIKELARPKKVW